MDGWIYSLPASQPDRQTPGGRPTVYASAPLLLASTTTTLTDMWGLLLRGSGRQGDVGDGLVGSTAVFHFPLFEPLDT